MNAAARQLAMFPLGTALLPGGLLPLHVFEPRYRAMIQDCLAADGEPEFGQVLIIRGRETGGGDERAMIGTVTRLVQIDALDGGQRYVVLGVGTRRLRVERWLSDDPYPRALVVDWPDEVDPRPDPSTIARLTGRVIEVVELAADVERIERQHHGPTSSDDVRHHAEPGDVDVSDDPVTASYQLATLAPIGPADRHRLLAEPGPAKRLTVLDSILDDVAAMLKFRLS